MIMILRVMLMIITPGFPGSSQGWHCTSATSSAPPPPPSTVSTRSVKFVGRKASLRPTFCQLDGEGGSEVESESEEDRQGDAPSSTSFSPSSPPTPTAQEVKVKQSMSCRTCFNTYQSILSNIGGARRTHEFVCFESATVTYFK